MSSYKQVAAMTLAIALTFSGGLVLIHDAVIFKNFDCGSSWRFVYGHGVRIHGGESVRPDPSLNAVCKAKALPYAVSGSVLVGAGIFIGVAGAALRRTRVRPGSTSEIHEKSARL